jgi:hypothetical protein
LNVSGTFLARLMLSVLAAMQGVASCAVDLNRTQATNSLWPGHARFHVVWQSCTFMLGAAVELALIWWAGPGMRSRFYLVAILTAIPMVGFVLAAIFRPLYRGTLRDPNGVSPLRVRIVSRIFEWEGNAVAIGAGLAVLAIAVWFFHLAA